MLTQFEHYTVRNVLVSISLVNYFELSPILRDADSSSNGAAWI